jgi:hypothetical protein
MARHMSLAVLASSVEQDSAERNLVVNRWHEIDGEHAVEGEQI